MIVEEIKIDEKREGREERKEGETGHLFERVEYVHG
jgi:hypothetical protein